MLERGVCILMAGPNLSSPLFLNWLLCKLKFLVPIVDFTPTPSVISQVMHMYLNHVYELTWNYVSSVLFVKCTMHWFLPSSATFLLARVLGMLSSFFLHYLNLKKRSLELFLKSCCFIWLFCIGSSLLFYSPQRKVWFEWFHKVSGFRHSYS